MTADQRATEHTGIVPFALNVPTEAIDDLHSRLRASRFPEHETVLGSHDEWAQGIPLTYVHELCQYWLHDHDWRRLEAELNGLGQWTTEIDGLDIHFLHVRSSRADARPLLITHGWPGSVVEALDVVDGLVNPPDDEPAFHVVLPSLPGFGFSGKPSTPGWVLRRIADAWAELMTRLGYERFLAQGGDWGAMVTITLAIHHPDRVAMIHTTVPHATRPSGFSDDELTATERDWLDHETQFRRTGMGYAAIQSTRPQTIGYGFVDSPTAQLAWIIEKFHDAADCQGHPENAVSRQRLLDNVAFYWFSASGASSARLYWESARNGSGLDMTTPVTVPTAVSVFPEELRKLPRSWVERRFVDLRHWNVLDRGGHFPMLETPTTFVAELRASFRDAPPPPR
ncbi:epoxide hydrolase family protein [Rothia koreensis]|uniref:epoxide hydrolase family protein n=1 Tax=Rothia koreensis TaxID=592378 RepID=UPI0037CB9BAA